jgi:hypothetical protein
LLPPLKLLHPESTLIRSKLTVFEKISTETILSSLMPGKESCLKTRPDGTILDGHHRIFVLKSRGVDVDKLPREIVAKTEF